MKIAAWMIAAFALFPGQALAQAHITPAAIENIMAQAEPVSPNAARVPAGLPLTAALFANRPWWAVLQMCAEHNGGVGYAPGTAPELTPMLEKRRKLFIFRAAGQFAKETGLPNPTEALLPASQWGIEFAKGMRAEAAKGSWSAPEFEDACRILVTEHVRAG